MVSTARAASRSAGAWDEHVEPYPGVQLDQCPLVRRQRPGPRSRPFGQRHVADGAQQRCQTPCRESVVGSSRPRSALRAGRARSSRGAVRGRAPPPPREHAHAARRASLHLVLEPACLSAAPAWSPSASSSSSPTSSKPSGRLAQTITPWNRSRRYSGMATSASISAFGAGGLGGAGSGGRRPGRSRPGPAPRARSAGRPRCAWVVLEAHPVDHVEVAVAVRVGAGDQQALLGPDEPDRRAQDQRMHVLVLVRRGAARSRSARCSWPRSSRLHSRSAPRLAGAEPARHARARLDAAQLLLDALALRARRRGTLPGARTGTLPPAGREDRDDGECRGRHRGGDADVRPQAERQPETGGDQATAPATSSGPRCSRRDPPVSVGPRGNVPGSYPPAVAARPLRPTFWRPRCGSWAGRRP